ncbi:Uncharacterized protein Fot_21748 [Forsythia ovata]|uniref:Uncharacterized protein n=1 Tax=Forsythia ovata TaxID=205694 RepID=A0ABD1UVZ9_9LAMI
MNDDLSKRLLNGNSRVRDVPLHPYGGSGLQRWEIGEITSQILIVSKSTFTRRLEDRFILRWSVDSDGFVENKTIKLGPIIPSNDIALADRKKSASSDCKKSALANCIANLPQQIASNLMYNLVHQIA